MRVRTLAVGLLTAALALTACGKEGTPSTNPGGTGGETGSNGNAQLPVVEVDKTVALTGSKAFDRAKAAGKITVGVKEDQPGMGSKDPTTGEFSGFDIEIARMVAAKLGFDPKTQINYKVVQSAGREAAITNGDVDIYVGTYTINDKRKQQISFAGPYFVAGQSLLVRKDDDSITGKDTLKGKKVCSGTGTTPIQRVRDQQLTEPQNIVEFQGYSQCVDKLLAKEVDAVTTDDAILKGYASEDKDALKVVGEPFSTEPYGIGLGKDDKVLRDKVNDILQSSLDDGTWQKIYDATLGKSGSATTKPTIERY